jgi:ABC-2 type transport system ATP-binding protein
VAKLRFPTPAPCGRTPLTASDLSKSYGSLEIFTAVDLAIDKGSKVVVLGLNGAGKTTLFSLISHLYNTRHGAIRIFGHDITRASGEALRRLGIVFQARTLDLDLSIYQNLSYHASLHGLGSAEARRRIDAVLETVEMGGRLHDKARSLSGGQMRRVEIARALLHAPRLILLDEPTVGLDIKSRADMLDHVRTLVAEERVCALWATHLIDEVADGDDVIVLHQGRLLAHGPVARVVAEQKAPDIRAAFTALTRSAAGADAEAA